MFFFGNFYFIVFFFCFRMQQQQLAAQLANHGGSTRQPPLSPTPNTSDSDSDISLGAHSPPISSPGPLRFGTSSPTPITSFRFGPHSPGPMPAQFRFANHTPPAFRLDRQSSPNFRLDRKMSPESPINVETTTTTTSSFQSRLPNISPINVDSNSEYRGDKDSPIRVDNSPPQTSLQHSPPMNLRISDNLRLSHDLAMRMQPETPLPLRLGGGSQLSTPLRIQVSNSNSSSQTNLHLATTAHAGIVRIASSSSPSNVPLLHRPFSPPRLT